MKIIIRSLEFLMIALVMMKLFMVNKEFLMSNSIVFPP